MKKPSHRRHDLSDHLWALLAPHLPGRKGSWGRVARDNRRFINAVLWMMRTGLPWRHLTADYGGWSNTHRRFIRWRDKGVWERLMEILIEKNRKVQRLYDKERYKRRHLVENAFLHLKRWRGIATCYAKNSASFLAVIHIRCIDLWAKSRDYTI